MSQKGFSVKQNKPFLDSQASYALIINELTNQHNNRLFVSKTSFLYFGSNLIDLTENKYAEPHIRSAYLYTYIPFHQSVSGCRSSSVFRANVRLTARRIYSKVAGYTCLNGKQDEPAAHKKNGNTAIIYIYNVLLYDAYSGLKKWETRIKIQNTERL